jgi:hypothetical protein
VPPSKPSIIESCKLWGSLKKPNLAFLAELRISSRWFIFKTPSTDIRPLLPLKAKVSMLEAAPISLPSVSLNKNNPLLDSEIHCPSEALKPPSNGMKWHPQSIAYL